MTNTDGNLYALEKHLAEREDQDERLDLQALLETYEIENDELSRKLAKAVEALQKIASHPYSWRTLARKTLAELEGKNE
jgi:hypothetical protein